MYIYIGCEGIVILLSISESPTCSVSHLLLSYCLRPRRAIGWAGDHGEPRKFHVQVAYWGVAGEYAREYVNIGICDIGFIEELYCLIPY